LRLADFPSLSGTFITFNPQQDDGRE